MIKTAWIIFIIVLAGTLALEFYMHPHVVFGLEATPFFHAWFGFASCAAIIVISKLLGYLLKRPENHYGDGE